MAPVYIRLHDGPDSKKGQDLIPDLQLVLVVLVVGYACWDVLRRLRRVFQADVPSSSGCHGCRACPESAGNTLVAIGPVTSRTISTEDSSLGSGNESAATAKR